MISISTWSPQLKQRMMASIVLPPGYTKLKGDLPVLVINDAQNAWTDRGPYGGIHIDSTMMRLWKRRRIRPVILVGVYSPHWRDRVYGPPPGGGAQKYADFVADALLPEVRARFRISSRRTEIGMIGASFGANAALSAAILRPDVFGMAASLSAAPHFGKSLWHYFTEEKKLPMHRLYIDCGTRWAYDDPYGYGCDNVGFNRSLMRAATERLPEGHFLGVVKAGHFHTEEFWRKRIGKILKFLYPMK